MIKAYAGAICGNRSATQQYYIMITTFFNKFAALEITT